jgi:choline dehydrogenase-like flavoprotein
VGANFSSSQVTIPPALATGRLKIISNAMAREIVIGSNGKAVAVSYIDKQTRTEQTVRAKAVVLSASACESARLLLNSKSALFPHGLANSSGTVGRYLMDTTATGIIAHFPQLATVPPHNDEGTGSIHKYIPWWKYGRQNDFLGGYHIELYGGRTMPLVGMFDGVCRSFEGYGRALKKTCREMYGTFAALEGRGAMIPSERSYCEIDPDVTDDWGIPVLRFRFRWSENEVKMAEDMRGSCEEIVQAAGGTVMAGEDWWRAVLLSIAGATPIVPRAAAAPERPYGYLNPGGVAHEVGTVRMGADPKNSVLNRFCQAHEVTNLFVTDGACFTTSPDKNPTLTILALSWRASEYLLDQARKGNL